MKSRPRSLRYATAKFENLRGTAVARSIRNAVVRGVRGQLRQKRLYVPGYRLASKGPAADTLLNYIPVEFDASIEPGSLPVQLFSAAKEIFAWTDGGTEAFLIDPRDVSLINQVPNAYYLEWPGRRWLLAVPEELIVNGADDSWNQASLVVW